MSKKVKELNSLHKEIWALMSKYVRLRDKKCVSCGVDNGYANMQAGHFIHGKCMDFVFNNINCQCIRCNKWLHGNLAYYADYLIDKHGSKIVKTLINTWKRRHGKEYSRQELVKLSKLLERKIKELEKD